MKLIIAAVLSVYFALMIGAGFMAGQAPMGCEARR